jgi:hypothetical protein
VKTFEGTYALAHHRGDATGDLYRIGLFMIVSVDRPFRGEPGFEADSYQLIHDQLMESKP